VPRRSAEEVVLQTHLFAGFPSAINGFLALERAWPVAAGSGRKTKPSGGQAGAGRADADRGGDGRAWRARGERLCRRVYGPTYSRLRARMRELSPALDEWAVVNGYGRTLSRPGLDAAARELCAVAALVALGVARQLEAHVEGAKRLGVERALVVAAAREAIRCYAPSARRGALESALRPRGKA
jgi:4-carboxymuconolactone decarboxylase